MVLRGMDLLLECIASGVYVQLAPPPLAALQEDASGSLYTLCFCHGLGATHRHLHPTLAVFFMGNEERRWVGILDAS